MSDAIDPMKLDRLAEVGVKVGLNLQPGQDLILTAPVEALPLVRRVVEAAYKAGAGLVTTILNDSEITLARYRHGQDESFDRSTDWLFQGMAQAFSKGAARMAIVGDDPMLLSEQDPSKVARAAKAQSIAAKPAMEHITNFDINWSIISWPGQAWSRRVFPGLSDDQAQEKLAEAIFKASRVTGNDPVGAWADHNAALLSRREWLNGQNFAALHFRGPGTDLTVGLAEGHSWAGGAAPAKNGVICNPNMPTEEVFTTPHSQRVDGTVRASKPLSHQGTLIEGIEMRFEAGRVVEARASKGEEVLLKLLDTDEGARRLGEVALVPHGSPISQSGILFLNTLFDENAACHIALGQCYAKCFTDGDLTQDEITARGGNQSLIHVDWMIGGPETDIDGITQDGARVPVFRKGNWA